MRRIAALSIAVLLTGCGGGDGDSVEEPPATIQALSVWKNLVASKRSWTTQGTGSDGASYEFTTTIRPRGSAQLAPDSSTPASTFDTVELAIAMKRNSEAYSSSSYLFYLAPSDKKLTYIVNPVLSSCTRPPGAQTFEHIPESASLNASKPMFEGLGYVLSGVTCQYPDAILNAPALGVSWSYEAVSSTPFLCINTTSRVTTFMTRQNACFEVTNLTGVGSKSRFNFSVTGFSVDAKNF